MSNEKKFYTGKIDFLGKAKFLVPLSFIITFLGFFEIGYDGLDYGIDFIGGTEIQVQFQNSVPTEDLRAMVTGMGYAKASVQRFGEDNEFLIRVEALQGKDDKETNELQNAMMAKITEGLRSQFQSNPSEIRRIDSVGPQVGEELKRNALLAAFYSLLMILVYIGLRFDYKYAPGAVFCLLHDVVITISIFAIFDREVNVQTMAAILTLIGYSLNDTIINYDRIRENEKLYRGEDIYGIVNRSINDMLSRTILTMVTTELAIAALYFLTDGVIQQIAFTLGIGILIGTYSSIYIASPLVIIMDRLMEKRSRARMRAAKV